MGGNYRDAVALDCRLRKSKPRSLIKMLLREEKQASRVSPSSKGGTSYKLFWNTSLKPSQVKNWKRCSEWGALKGWDPLPHKLTSLNSLLRGVTLASRGWNWHRKKKEENLEKSRLARWKALLTKYSARFYPCLQAILKKTCFRFS